MDLVGSRLLERVPSHLKARYHDAVVLATIYGTVYGFYRWWKIDNTKYQIEENPCDTDADKLLKGVMNFTISQLLLTAYVSGGGLLGGLFVSGLPVTFPAYYLYQKHKNDAQKNIDI
jgi:hypothetical protein